jgi:hypothetical protein
MRSSDLQPVPQEETMRLGHAWTAGSILAAIFIVGFTLLAIQPSDAVQPRMLRPGEIVKVDLRLFGADFTLEGKIDKVNWQNEHCDCRHGEPAPSADEVLAFRWPWSKQ